MTKQQIQLIKDCVPILKKDGVKLTNEFYKILFNTYPEVKSMFDMKKQDSNEQPKALAFAILTAAQNIENLEKMKDFVNKVAITHTRLNVKANHYPLVGECLLKAIKNILNVDDDLLKAWELAYDKISKFYINIEDKIYIEK